MLFIIHYFYFFFFIHCTITYFFFFFNDTATTEIYTLSLHDALPIFVESSQGGQQTIQGTVQRVRIEARSCWLDRKSTRLNSSHGYISYAVFCLKKKKITKYIYSVENKVIYLLTYYEFTLYSLCH